MTGQGDQPIYSELSELVLYDTSHTKTLPDAVTKEWSVEDMDLHGDMGDDVRVQSVKCMLDKLKKLKGGAFRGLHR